MTTSHQVSGWDRFPIASWLAEVLGIEESAVALENDADAAGLAEARRGAGAGVSPILYVTIGSGVGGGLVIDGRIYRGAGLGASEVGQIRIGSADDPKATVESLASGWAIAEAGRLRIGHGPLAELCGRDPARVDAALVAEAAVAGDPSAIAIIQNAAEALGRGLATAATLLAPARIVLGGGVSALIGSDWGRQVRASFEDWSFGSFRGKIPIVPAALGESVVVVGALILAGDRGIDARP